eukprot:gnl/TRDRNA2_/TRDRNA2_190774_c0_seq1.p1 gnl/TRDRNA2_/TRDRNA2_190774_c0~~gnl/TRDRNA2_/TRDRNA2_190774_c0_seq1.p1  ORF type:complete len:277 (-),score=60.55 gnl/TRDRNA2_/TRDRNA2_190774_c0_seq1:67-780(-)
MGYGGASLSTKAPTAKSLAKQSERRDVFATSDGLRTLAKGDSLVSEKTAQIARRHIDERAQRAGAEEFLENVRSFSAADEAGNAEERGEEETVVLSAIGQDEREDYERQRSAKQRNEEEFRKALGAFRAEKRLRPADEDPLENLEWKVKETRPSRPQVRAVLGVKRKQLRHDAVDGDAAEAAATSTAAPAAPAADTAAAELSSCTASAQKTTSLVAYTSDESDSDSESETGMKPGVT